MKNKKTQILLAASTLFIFVPIFSSETKLDLDKVQLRAFSGFVPENTTGTSKLEFDKTVLAFRPDTYFYMGAKATPTKAKNFSITRVRALSGESEISPITPETITRLKEEGGTEEINNPLYAQAITNLALFLDIYPIATIQTADPEYKIYSILDPQGDGKTVADTGDEFIKDSAGDSSKECKALAGSNSYIFAAISAKEQIWDEPSDAGKARGIAILKADLSPQAPTNPSLKQLDAEDLSNTEATAKAKNVSLAPADNLVCFSEAANPTDKITQANIGSNVDIFWDSGLQRLFIALSDVKRDDTAKEGGCFSILVGRIGTTSDNKSKLFLTPILYKPTKAMFGAETGTSKFIVDFYYNTTDTDAITITTKKLRVMHTSTGKNYLIANCNVVGTSGNNYNYVFALPILGSLKPDGKSFADDSMIGTLSKLDTNNLPTFDSAPTAPGEMPQNGQIAAWVGKDGIQDTKNLTDLFVHGDSVYACFRDTTSTAPTQNDGIFQSTALFNKNGIIIGWTPWQRVMGSVDAVYGGGIDDWSNFYFLAGQNDDTTKANTVKITQWGKTDEVNKNATIKNDTFVWEEDSNKNLSSMLSSIFPKEQGGIFQIINFDEQTDGFNKSHFSMMVAVGYDKIALIQTGVTNAGKFMPTSEKFEVGKNVFVFEDQALKEIAPLCFAEVARNTAANSGWLFVGGYGGVAVLSKDNGDGWDSATGLLNLEATAFPGAGYSFKKLTPSAKENDFKYVRKLASLVSNDAQKLFIQTSNNLYSIDQTAANFQTGSSTETKHLNNIPQNLRFTDLLIIPNNDTFTSTLINTYKFIFGSTYGLLTSTYATLGILSGGSATSDPVLHLNYISQTKGKNGTKGNLYTLSTNLLTNAGKVYRYHVDGSINTSASDAVQLIDQYLDLRSFRGNFVTDGAFGFSLLAKAPCCINRCCTNQCSTNMCSSNMCNSNMINLYQIKAKTDTFNPSDYVRSLDDLPIFDNCNWYVGVITRNTASGSWLIPGDWGVMVNE